MGALPAAPGTEPARMGGAPVYISGSFLHRSQIFPLSAMITSLKCNIEETFRCRMSPAVERAISCKQADQLQQPADRCSPVSCLSAAQLTPVSLRRVIKRATLCKCQQRCCKCSATSVACAEPLCTRLTSTVSVLPVWVNPTQNPRSLRRAALTTRVCLSPLCASRLLSFQRVDPPLALFCLFPPRNLRGKNSGVRGLNDRIHVSSRRLRSCMPHSLRKERSSQFSSPTRTVPLDSSSRLFSSGGSEEDLCDNRMSLMASDTEV